MPKQIKRELPPKYKIVFLGETAVGKTALITKYVFATETKEHHPTIGVDFFAQKKEIGGRMVSLQFWDTAGQERFKSLIPSYTRESFMAVILFDLTKRETFDDIDAWITDVVLKNNDAGVKLVIAGNKVDLRKKLPEEEIKERNLPTEQEILDKARKYHAEYVETCALSTEGIKDLVSVIVRAVETSAVPDPRPPEFSVEAQPTRRCVCM